MQLKKSLHALSKVLSCEAHLLWTQLKQPELLESIVCWRQLEEEELPPPLLLLLLHASIATAPTSTVTTVVALRSGLLILVPPASEGQAYTRSRSGVDKMARRRPGHPGRLRRSSACLRWARRRAPSIV